MALRKDKQYIVTLKDGSTYTATNVSQEKIEEQLENMKNQKDTMLDEYLSSYTDVEEVFKNWDNGDFSMTGEVVKAIDSVAKDSSLLKLVAMYFERERAKGRNTSQIGKGRRIKRGRQQEELIKKIFENLRTKELPVKEFCAKYGVTKTKYFRIRNWETNYKNQDDIAWLKKIKIESEK